MDVYVYRGNRYCADCARDLMDSLHPEEQPDFRGPYPDGGGKSGRPEHCGNCDVFLGNPLTSGGEDYIIEAVKRSFDWPEVPPHIKTWVDYYGVKPLDYFWSLSLDGGTDVETGDCNDENGWHGFIKVAPREVALFNLEPKTAWFHLVQDSQGLKGGEELTNQEYLDLVAELEVESEEPEESDDSEA